MGSSVRFYLTTLSSCAYILLLLQSANASNLMGNPHQHDAGKSKHELDPKGQNPNHIHSSSISNHKDARNLARNQVKDAKKHVHWSDDGSQGKLTSVRKPHASKPGKTGYSVKDLNKMIASIQSLRIRKAEVAQRLKNQKGLYDFAFRQKKASNLKRSIYWRESNAQALMRKQSEDRLHGMRKELPHFQENLTALIADAALKDQVLKKLTVQQANLIRQHRRLIRTFEKHGLKHWVESNVHGKMSPFLSDAFVEGTTFVMESFLDGMDKAVKMNTKISLQIAARGSNKYHVHSEFITLWVALFPFLVVMSILLRVQRRLSQLTLIQYILLANIYFALLSFGCLIASAAGSVDVLITLRKKSSGLYGFLVLLHCATYGIVCVLQIATCVNTKTVHLIVNTIAFLGVGFHFFFHFISHLKKGELPHVDIATYAMYTVVFFGSAICRLLGTKTRKASSRPDSCNTSGEHQNPSEFLSILDNITINITEPASETNFPSPSISSHIAHVLEKEA